ncbi:hypothetical protein DPMN_009886 [Dreissena polymorpha]|uniref:Uncharacterized protein n=1 Tax=Dreissena polymorpha TaxID=45954 RepID=A0A9D4MXT0_DREPO|nr:hypothetical protein DPMN_009886 [Dreissena polymorpha]
MAAMKNALDPGGHVFQQTRTILNSPKISLQRILKNKSCFNKWDKQSNKANVDDRPCMTDKKPLQTSPYGHVFQQTGTISISSKISLKQTDVASRVLTRFYYSHFKKNALPPGDIIGTNILIRFYEDWTINVASS